MIKKMTKEDARNLLRHRGVSLKDSFYTLSASKVTDILDVADKMHYQKPKNANGSRARYFFAYLKSGRGE
jgi:hypothetical protein